MLYPIIYRQSMHCIVRYCYDLRKRIITRCHPMVDNDTIKQIRNLYLGGCQTASNLGDIYGTYESTFGNLQRRMDHMDVYE